MNCIYKKVRTKKGKKYGYCTLLKKEVNLFNCKCSSITYKKINPIKSRTNKQAQKEKERFSIIYTDLTKCCECGLKAGDFDTRLNLYTRIEKNEIFSGSYRSISMKDGMVAPLCIFCHKRFHKDIIFNLSYKVKFQKEYMKTHTLEEFITRYGQNYIYKLEQKKRGKDI